MRGIMEILGHYDHIKDIEEFKKHHNKIVQEIYKKLMKRVKFPKDFLKTFIKSHKRIIMEGEQDAPRAHVFETVVDYTLIMTDFYMLCRMFQKYDVSKNRGPKKCPIAYAERMILYAGANHNKHIKYFRRDVGIKPVFYVSMRNTKRRLCICSVQ